MHQTWQSIRYRHKKDGKTAPPEEVIDRAIIGSGNREEGEGGDERKNDGRGG